MKKKIINRQAISQPQNRHPKFQEKKNKKNLGFRETQNPQPTRSTRQKREILKDGRMFVCSENGNVGEQYLLLQHWQWDRAEDGIVERERTQHDDGGIGLGAAVEERERERGSRRNYREEE